MNGLKENRLLANKNVVYVVLSFISCIPMQIQPYNAHHREAIVRLSLRAWGPVFASIQSTLNAYVYQTFYPEDWQTSQQAAVESGCAAEDTHVWVAMESDTTAGFVAVKLCPDDCMGEIYMVAVDPAFQGQGIGQALTAFALDWMKQAGMAIAMVETGGDVGHAPARRTYEKAGFELWPVARYFKAL